MEKFIKVDWPKYQEYMDKWWFDDESYYNTVSDCYFIPEKYYYINLWQKYGER